MKLKLLILLPVFALISFTSKAAEVSDTTIVFDKLEHDFATVKESIGDAVATFTFTNKSDKPIVISNVLASCGCTTPDWTKEPVKPGETGFVKAAYGAKGRLGPFIKTVTVTSSANPKYIVLRFQGNVVSD